jgi:predicted RNA-binding Zn-ribbon protein involved in translation (DUF1610 family)
MAGLPLFPGGLSLAAAQEQAQLGNMLGNALLPSGGLLLPPPPGATAPGGALSIAPGDPFTAGPLPLNFGLMSLLPGGLPLRINPATGMPLAPSEALRPGDWKCPNCGDHVFASRSECRKCKTLKPEPVGIVPPPPAASGKQGDWTCTKCGFDNYANRDECRRCGAARPEDVEKSLPPPPAPAPAPAPAPPPEPKKPTQKWPIFIGNIAYETTVDEVREIFKDSKGLLTVQLASDAGGSRGFGFAEFDNRPDAEEAMKVLDGTEIRSRGIRLRWGQSAPTKDAETPAQAGAASAPPVSVEKVAVPFSTFEGTTNEEKQRKAYQCVLGVGATNMRFMMKT